MKKTERKVSVQPKNGFTLLEVMIAVSIFGFLMLYVTQFMKLQIGTYNQASKENDIEQKARIAVMHILDEARLNSYTFYQKDASENDGPGIYRTDPDTHVTTCLVDFDSKARLDVNASPKAEIYYDGTEESQGNGKLYYQTASFDKYLIADSIIAFSIVPEPLSDDNSSLMKIDIKVGLPAGSSGGVYVPQPYELVTWVRLF